MLTHDKDFLSGEERVGGKLSIILVIQSKSLNFRSNVMTLLESEPDFATN